MQDAKEDVRARLAIEDVIGEYVVLKRAGRNFKGLSPFTSEKSPSFVVSPEKNIWHDFSSNKGGDIFGFIMEVEGMDFRQALEYLAKKAGVELAKYDAKGAGDLSKKKQRLIEANELAARYYQQSLLKNEHALEYVVKKRKLNKQTIEDFKIGYSPDSGEALVQFLAKKGFSKQELADAGLTNRFGGDLFRGRMMVSLMDHSGSVIGFTGRILQDDPKAPKYLNTPQSLIYDKSRHVFGFSLAKEAIRKQGHSVVVEGNMDVIASHQAGFRHVVATAGTALTEQHLKVLSRLSSEVKLAFDGDRAGLEATERAIPIAQQVGVDLTIISLPDVFKDPDELIQKDPRLWQDAIDASAPVVDWILAQYSQREDVSTAAGKRIFTNQALAVLVKLTDSVEIEHYLNKIAEIVQTSVDALKQKLDTFDPVSDEKVKKRIAQSARGVIEDESVYQDNLLALSAIDMTTRDLMGKLQPTMFDGEQRSELFEYLMKKAKNPLTDTPKELQNHDTYVKIVLLKADTRYASWSEQDRYSEAARLVRRIIVKNKEKQKDQLTRELRDAEDMGDDKKALTIRSKLNLLIKEIHSAR